MNDQPFLQIAGGTDHDQTIELGVTTTVFGRLPSNDVVVSEMGVSRQHAEITVKEDGCYLQDLASSNGTYVSGKQLGIDEQLLRDGDQIRLGPSEVSFVFRRL